MVAGNNLFFPIVVFASFVSILYISFGGLWADHSERKVSFVERNGTHFMVDGGVYYVNGWNSYWLMDQAASEYGKRRIKAMLQAGAKMGLTVCRTWAFNDGDYNALQISPGEFDEKVFRALDYVIAEARQQGVRLLLALVNNLEAYGGKTQYVKWAWEEGLGLTSSNDSFFYDPSIRHYFKDYLKTVLTRKNTITGIEYRDDPTIFGWELINEPRCATDASGNTLQVLGLSNIMCNFHVLSVAPYFFSFFEDWIEEMSTFLKEIDKKHLLTVGLEGFYGPRSPKRLTENPELWASELGTDFIRNSMIPTIDFASVHIYPDHWTPVEDLEYKLKFVSTWMESHIEDGDKELMKPIMFTEFGLSSENFGFNPAQRDRFYKIVFDLIYKSAKNRGSGAGSFPWQFLVGGMEDYNDEFGIVPWEIPSTFKLITEQSCRVARTRGVMLWQTGYLKQLCSG